MENQNPFAMARPAEGVNAGTIAVEQSRAVAESAGKLWLAKQSPRNQSLAFDKLMQTCSRRSFADTALYSFPRGGDIIKGASIRLAEELARCWGNISFGIRELSQSNGIAEWMAFAWDTETNVECIKNFTVKHERHTRRGVVALTDPRDIYEIGANQGGRRLRACILSVIPPDLVEEAINQCYKTMAGNSDIPMADRVKAIITAFAPYGVTNKHIEEWLGKKTSDMLVDELVDLRTIFASLKDGMAKASDYFGGVDPSGEASAKAGKINEILKGKGDAKGIPNPETGK